MKTIIDYINCLIKPFVKDAPINGLVEMIKRPQLKDNTKFDLFPAVYQNNEYRKVEYGIYHRLIGKSRSVLDEESTCGDEIYTRAFPMRLVAILIKDATKDNQYEDLSIAESLASLIEFTHNKTLSIDINADSVYTQVNSIETDRDAVFKREYSGENFVDYNRTLIAIDYTIFINGSKVCLNECLL